MWTHGHSESYEQYNKATKAFVLWSIAATGNHKDISFQRVKKVKKCESQLQKVA